MAACQQMTTMLRTLCPPAHLTFRLKRVLLPHDNEHTGTLQFSLITATVCDFAPCGQSGTPYTERLRAALLEEFSAQTPSSESQQGTTFGAERHITLVGMGVGGCAAPASMPRGCKWSAYAGIVFTMPDHFSAFAAQDPSHLPDAGSQSADTRENPCSTPLYYFKHFSLQMETPGNGALRDVLRRCAWPAHGFQLVAVDSSAPGPLHLSLTCAQPRSGACIAAIVIHLLPAVADSAGGQNRGAAAGCQGPSPKLSGRIESGIVRCAVDCALAQLKEQCPVVMADRRERSLGRAIPVVATAVAGILARSQRAETLEEVCRALELGPDRVQEGLEVALGEALSGALAPLRG